MQIDEAHAHYSKINQVSQNKLGYKLVSRFLTEPKVESVPQTV